MKKFLEYFRNIKDIIKILQMFSEILTSVVEIYNKYYPAENVEQSKE